MKKKLVGLLIYLVVAPLIWLYLRLIMWTSRITTVGEKNPDRFCDEGQGHIFVFWHNQQFILPQLRQNREIYSLISDSRDGDYLSFLVKFFGKIPVRGSSSKKGAQALKKLIRLLKHGAAIAVATDGPRGPAFEVKPGVVQMAQMTGVAIVPIAYAASKKKTFNSWDQSILPYPFGSLGIVYGEPVYLDRKLSMEEGLRRVKQALDQANQSAAELISG